VAKGYYYNNATKALDRVPLFEPGSALYPGGMYSTARDLCRYISSQFDDMSSRSPKVMSAGGRAMMRSLKLGWKPAYPFALHEGAMPGYRSIVVFNPDSKLGWVVLTNVQDVDFNAINNQLADITGKLFRKPKSRELAPYAGTYRLPHGYGSLDITVKNDSLYSSYIQDLLPGQPLVPDGEYKFKAQGKNGYAVQYEFVPGDTQAIKALRMGQFVWYKE